MPPPDIIMKPLIAFLTASTWDDSHSVLNAHQDMLPLWVEVIDVMLTDPTAVYGAWSGQRRKRRCRRTGACCCDASRLVSPGPSPK